MLVTLDQNAQTRMSLVCVWVPNSSNTFAAREVYQSRKCNIGVPLEETDMLHWNKDACWLQAPCWAGPPPLQRWRGGGPPKE